MLRRSGLIFHFCVTSLAFLLILPNVAGIGNRTSEVWEFVASFLSLIGFPTITSRTDHLFLFKYSGVREMKTKGLWIVYDGLLDVSGK